VANTHFSRLNGADRVLEYQLTRAALCSTQQDGILVCLLDLAAQADSIDQIDGDCLANEVVHKIRLQGIGRWLGGDLGWLSLTRLAGLLGDFCF